MGRKIISSPSHPVGDACIDFVFDHRTCSHLHILLVRLKVCVRVGNVRTAARARDAGFRRGLIKMMRVWQQQKMKHTWMVQYGNHEWRSERGVITGASVHTRALQD